MRHLEVLFNVLGQKFFYDPPEGRPTGTPTVQVFSTGTDDDGTAETATTGVCSVDSVDTQLTAAIDAGTTTIPLASAVGVSRLRRYVLADPSGLSELVEVVAVSGLNATIRQPLNNSYALASTFKGCRISIDINATWVAAKPKITDVLGEVWRTTVATPSEWAPGAAGYRLRWAYTVDGEAQIGVSYADLVRYRARSLVSPLDVDGRFPGWIDRIPIDYRADQGRTFIDEAFQAVKLDALSSSQVIRRIRSTEVLRELAIYRANLISAEANVTANGADVAALTAARELYRQRFDTLLVEPKVPVDNTGGGSNGQAKRSRAWRR